MEVEVIEFVGNGEGYPPPGTIEKTITFVPDETAYR